LRIIRQCRIIMSIEFIETSLFTSLIYNYLSEDEIWLLTVYSKGEQKNYPRAHIEEIKID